MNKKKIGGHDMKRLLLVVSIVLTGTIMILLGCELNEEGKALNPDGAASLQTANQVADKMIVDGLTYQTIEKPITLTLSNGVEVVSDKFIKDTGQFTVPLTYKKITGESFIRELRIKKDFTSVEERDNRGSFVFAYSWSAFATGNKATLNLRSAEHNFSQTIYSQENRIDFTLDGAHWSLAFDSREQLDSMIEIYGRVQSGTSIDDLTARDQELLGVYQQSVDFVNSAPSLMNSWDGQTTTLLLAHEGFVKHLAEPEAWQSTYVSARVVCGAAGLISTGTCWNPALALICVPSLGVSIACGIADVVSLFY